MGCDIIYETKNYQALVELFERCLKPDGMVIISSKAFYYGNEGSVAEFKQFVANSNPRLVYQQLKKIQTGMGNRREIFSLQLKE